VNDDGFAMHDVMSKNQGILIKIRARHERRSESGHKKRVDSKL